jgi:hypothetical protein
MVLFERSSQAGIAGSFTAAAHRRILIKLVAALFARSSRDFRFL